MSSTNGIVERLVILEKKVEDITAELKVVNNKNTQIKHQIHKLYG